MMLDYSDPYIIQIR